MGIFLLSSWRWCKYFLVSNLVRWTPHFYGACWCPCSRSPQCYWRRPHVLLTNSLRNSRSFTRILAKIEKHIFVFNCSRNHCQKNNIAKRKGKRAQFHEYLEEWLPASGWACTVLGSTPGA
jgi:hypothetical protein